MAGPRWTDSPRATAACGSTTGAWAAASPRLGRALAAGIPGARYEEIAAASHGVTLQCPERINALLLEHFSVARGTKPSDPAPRP